MPPGHLRTDLSLLRQGASLAREFGFRSLEGLTRIAELIEHSVYEPRSLTRTAEGVAFTLLNPPLRMGAFEEVRVRFDGSLLPPEAVTLTVPGAGVPRSAAELSRATPVTIPIGQRTTVHLTLEAPAPGPHHVRLELRSVAIPPRVWFEFTDSLPEGPA